MTHATQTRTIDVECLTEDETTPRLTVAVASQTGDCRRGCVIRALSKAQVEQLLGSPQATRVMAKMEAIVLHLHYLLDDGYDITSWEPRISGVSISVQPAISADPVLALEARDPAFADILNT